MVLNGVKGAKQQSVTNIMYAINSCFLMMITEGAGHILNLSKYHTIISLFNIFQGISQVRVQSPNQFGRFLLFCSLHELAHGFCLIKSTKKYFFDWNYHVI